MSFPGARLLGLRGRAEGLLKLGLMTSPVGVAVSGGAGAGPGTATVTGPSVAPNFASLAFDNSATGASDCWYAGVNPADIIIQFTGTSKVREVQATARPDSPNNCPTQIKLFYSDDGSTWTQVDGPGYTAAPTGAFVAFAAGQTQVFPAFSDAGAHSWWKLTCATPFTNDVSPVEMELHATVGGADIVVLGP